MDKHRVSNDVMRGWEGLRETVSRPTGDRLREVHLVRHIRLFRNDKMLICQYET